MKNGKVDDPPESLTALSGTVITLIILSALALTSFVPEGLKRRQVGGKSCACRMRRIGWWSGAPRSEMRGRGWQEG